MILFLDIDGVLATARSYVAYPAFQWDPVSVGAFVDLYKKLSADGVVISSDWRYFHDDAWFKSAFAHYGAPEIMILGSTEQDAPPDPDSESLIVLSTDCTSRGHKILKWMWDHDYFGEYVVLDDTMPIIRDAIPPENIIWTLDGFSKFGLTQLHVDLFLEQHLKRKNEQAR